MFQQGFRGVVVANAHEELQNLSDANVYQSPESFARGVLDGVDYWTNRHREQSKISGSTRGN
jgi:hypothetical protein